MISRLLPVLVFSMVASAQDLVTLTPSRDNSLFSESASTSNGGDASVFVGTELMGNERRALLAFDLSALPTGAVVTGAELQLTMTRTQAGSVEVRLHALIADWGEGSADGGAGGGAGAPAQPGDATWAFRFFNTESWAQAGGDFDPAPVSLADIQGPGSYLFAETPEFINLVQTWVDGSRDNFGFILVADPSLPDPTAKRFSSRENANVDHHPRLTVRFQAEAPTPVAASGIWFDPDLDGEGYNVVQADAGWVVFYYGYTSDGQRLWLISETSSEPLTLGGEVVLTLFRGQPGSFQMPSPSTQLETWGTLSVTLETCTSGRFVLQGADGMKTANVIKLAGIAGTTCEP